MSHITAQRRILYRKGLSDSAARPSWRSTMSQRMHIRVRGRVQGVSFRAYTQQVAASLGVRGYVRNLANGDVEIVAEGETQQLERLLAWARRGPPAAEVEEVQVERSEPTNAFRDFAIRY
ncbi:MAG TPA: acylphosphatase [Chthonomonadaceae bacterium]|nr:acylphosphatase [Chthonomonadaceae bacterium]